MKCFFMFAETVLDRDSGAFRSVMQTALAASHPFHTKEFGKAVLPVAQLLSCLVRMRVIQLAATSLLCWTRILVHRYKLKPYHPLLFFPLGCRIASRVVEMYGLHGSLLMNFFYMMLTMQLGAGRQLVRS